MSDDSRAGAGAGAGAGACAGADAAVVAKRVGGESGGERGGGEAITPGDLFEAAAMVLTTDDAEEQAKLSFTFATMFLDGRLPLRRTTTGGAAPAPPAPLVAVIVRAGTVKLGKEEACPASSMEQMDGLLSLKPRLHRLVHATHKAIIAAWDAIRNFGAFEDESTYTLLATAAKVHGRYFPVWLEGLRSFAGHYGWMTCSEDIDAALTKTRGDWPSRLAVVHMLLDAREFLDRGVLNRYFAERDGEDVLRLALEQHAQECAALTKRFVAEFAGLVPEPVSAFEAAVKGCFSDLSPFRSRAIATTHRAEAGLSQAFRAALFPTPPQSAATTAALHASGAALAADPAALPWLVNYVADRDGRGMSAALARRMVLFIGPGPGS